MIKLTTWNKLAYLFSTKELELHEIVQACIIFSVVGHFGDEKPVDELGFNVLDNKQIKDALIYGIVKQIPDDQAISHSDIGKMVLMHRNTVGQAVGRLQKKGYLKKVNYGTAGAFHKTDNMKSSNYPNWLFLFTKGLLEIHTNDALYSGVKEACKGIYFRRGMEILHSEIRAKFWHPSDKGTKSD